jgi:REP element-mobilizing transposase RayT
MLDRFPEIEQEIGRRALWSRGYYLRSVGEVVAATILNYLSRQSEHHAGGSQLLAEYRHPFANRFADLRPFSHCVAEYKCHIVICPVHHVPAIDRQFAEPLVRFILRVAAKRTFEVVSLTVMDDHVHLVAAITPSLSPAEVALTVMNNTSHWFSLHNPGVFKLWEIPGFWASSVYLGTVGAVTSGHIGNYLRRAGSGRTGC